MDKAALLRAILAQIDAELALAAQSARSAHAEATDEQSKAENKYDTRGLEASYLARGQSLKAAESMEARQQYAALEVRAFGKGEPIDVGALVTLQTPEGAELYFLGPRAGGVEVTIGRETVLVITPASPIGAQLRGRGAGEKFELTVGRLKRAVKITRVE